MHRFLCLIFLVCVSCSTVEAPSEPSPAFQKAVELALTHGFQLANQKGKVASIQSEVSNHWLKELSGVPSSIQTFRLELSNAEYSDVVDLEEWVFASAEDAEQIIVGFAEQRTKLREFKLLYKIWREDNRVYFVSTRAFMFEDEMEKIVSLLKR